jgi:hypothetical protein
VVRALLSLHLALQPPPGPGNQPEAESGIMCADGLQAASAASWPAVAAAADRGANYFGAYYAWISVQCARNTWTAHDEDVYVRSTAAPPHRRARP